MDTLYKVGNEVFESVQVHCAQPLADLTHYCECVSVPDSV